MKNHRAGRRGRSVPVSRREFLGLGFAAIGGASLVLPCASRAHAAAQPDKAAPSAAKRGKTITLAYPRHISTIDPRRNRITDEVNTYLHVYDPLVTMNQKLEVVPALAESWERVDLSTWRFRLRKGPIKFHNGEVFSAENVKFTVEQIAKLDPPYFYRSLWGGGWPPSAQIENAGSVLLKTPKPLPILPRLITRFGMLPLEATKDEKKYADNPVGTGPFRFVEWKKGERMVLETNPNYWRGASKIERLVYLGLPDDAARSTALEAGEIDMAWNLPPERVVRLPQSVGVIEVGSLNLGHFAFNFYRIAKDPKSPIANVEVRRALTYAVDGKQIVQHILGGKGSSSRAPSPMLSWGTPDCGGFPDRDVAKAKSLLSKAGYGSGLQLNLIINEGKFPKVTEISEAVVGQLAEVGVTIKLEQLEGGMFLQRSMGPDWDLQSCGTSGWTGDAEFFIGNLETTIGYKSAAVADALAKGAAAPSDKQRLPLLQQALKLMWDDVPNLWAFDVVWLHGLAKRVQGAMMIPNGWLMVDRADVTG
jgi:peptide/nickel transport system substrate-binding protein